jgi:predicted molibdopterin-dependent oxidoreductase YjgC
VTALAHVIVTEGLFDETFIRERCDWDEFQDYAEFAARPENSPESTALLTGVSAEELRAGTLFARRIDRPALTRTLYLVRQQAHEPFLHEDQIGAFLDNTVERLVARIGPYARRLS